MKTMNDDDSPARPGPRLRPKLARACERLAEVLEKSSQAGRMTPEEKREARHAIYGRFSEPDLEPEREATAPAFPDRRHLRPALARSAARLAELLVSPRNPAYWTVERREDAIREIYGLPPKHASASQ